MRTTVNIDDELLKKAKVEAARSGRTLAAIIEEALRESLARRGAVSSKRKRVKLPTSSGGRLMPGVDLDKTSELFETGGTFRGSSGH